ncbi:ABC transporter ATP-binding protein [Cellulosilyticum ruminicola]|uniref:ABC transporter ATP-binding protein n=1 Tax=Cellulosilyticum ruminicola TaxID=425254 RepID=UPI0006D1E716|nr:ABC transporter ATP-binding protein [Cellulosilyticum ruminicola]
MEEKKKQSPINTALGWGKAYKGQFFLSVVFAVIGVAGGVLPYFCGAQIVTGLLDGNEEMVFYSKWCMYALIGYVIRIVFICISTSISHRATYKTLRDLRLNLINKLTRLPMGTILDTPSGQYKTIIVDCVEGMESTLAHLLPEMTANILVPIVIIIYLFVLDWRMALASMITVVIGMGVLMMGMKDYPAKYEKAVELGKKMADTVIEYISGIEVIKTFNQSAGSYGKYKDAVSDNGNYYIEWMRENQKTMSIYQALLPSTLLAILPIGFLFWIKGSLEINEFITIIILSLAAMGPIMAAFTFTDDIAVLSTNIAEIEGILQAKELVRPNKEVGLVNNSIQMTHVSFRYDAAKDYVLKDITLEIKPNTMAALVGPSGSGKSTIAKLIAGFWDATTGSIKFGGVDIKQIPLTQLNKQIAYVSQDTYLFDKSIRENIRMGNPNASDEQVEEVARKAGCDEFIRKLDNRYETLVGTAGGQLSGGERQRITIARAMLKDAPIVILDEATAAMDPENEAEIQRAISALTKNKTLIVIAHRLSTITEADQIIVVNKGHIVETGTQEELLKNSDLYASMWHAHIDAKDQA